MLLNWQAWWVRTNDRHRCLRKLNKLAGGWLVCRLANLLVDNECQFANLCIHLYICLSCKETLNRSPLYLHASLCRFSLSSALLLKRDINRDFSQFWYYNRKILFRMIFIHRKMHSPKCKLIRFRKDWINFFTCLLRESILIPVWLTFNFTSCWVLSIMLSWWVTDAELASNFELLEITSWMSDELMFLAIHIFFIEDLYIYDE